MNIKELLSILRDGESSVIEFKKNWDADICKDVCAFANSKGGLLLLGVEDNGNPIGIKDNKIKQKISDKLQALRPIPKFQISEIPIAEITIISIQVEESSLLASYRNVVYIRAGTNSYPLSIDEVVEKSAESLRVFFDDLITDVPFSELNRKLFKDYLKQRKKIRGIDIKGNIEENALQLKVAKKKENQVFLTNGGVLCFTSNPQEYLPGSSVRLVVFNDERMRTYSDRQEFIGPLQKIVLDLERYFSANLSRIGGFTLGFRSRDYMEYSFPALRETIVNAIVHRNYFDPSETQIFIYPSRLEIKNPGSFPPGVTLKNPEHKPRNPSISQYFYDMGLVEKYGSGLKKIIEEAESHPLSEVQFDIKPYRTKIIFSKTMSNIELDLINKQILESLVNRQLSSTQIAKQIGLSRQATFARLNDLKTLGLLTQIGEGRSTLYTLIN